MRSKRCGVAAILACLTGATASAQVKVTVDPAKASGGVPVDYAGLSFETQRMLPDANGHRFFSVDNKPLVGMFNTLGIRSLRIGGNTADRATVPIPGTADIDELFKFAKAANCKVIYTLRLKDADPTDDARIAKYVMDHYGDLVTCIAVGNEPNVFAKEYPVYKTMMEKFIAAITAPGAAPKAVFCGPSSTPGKSAWARDFAKDFAAGGHVKFIAQHSYPGNSALKVTDPTAGREQMLSPEWTAGYQKFYDSFAATAVELGLGFRLEETNSFFHGGAKDVSDSFASTLWALDYMHWWAEHGASGLNFHTGDQVASGDAMKPCWYASFVSSPDGYVVRPIGYALKAFDIGGRGKRVPVKVDGGDSISAYSTTDGNKLWVTLINRAHGAGAKSSGVTLLGVAGFGDAKALPVNAHDLASTSGVTMGGTSIGSDGTWKGDWAPLSESQGGWLFEVMPASAVVVELTKEAGK